MSFWTKNVLLFPQKVLFSPGHVLFFFFFFCFFCGLFEEVVQFGHFWESNQNQSNQNQSTYRQGSWKVCVQQFHGQNEDWFRIFWALLVQFGLEIMCKEGFWEVLFFGFVGSNSSNLEGPKIYFVDAEMGSYLRKYKSLVKVFKMVICIRVGFICMQLCMKLSNFCFCEFQYIFKCLSNEK